MPAETAGNPRAVRHLVAPFATASDDPVPAIDNRQIQRHLVVLVTCAPEALGSSGNRTAIDRRRRCFPARRGFRVAPFTGAAAAIAAVSRLWLGARSDTRRVGTAWDRT